MGGTSEPIKSNRTDERGMVQVWDIPDQCWKTVAFVDAREQCERGTASLTGPDVELVGPAGSVVVCQSQVEEYVEKGYKVSPKSKSTPKPGDKDNGKGTKKDEGDGEPYNFAQHTKAELADFASKAGLKDYEDFNKAQLCEALDSSGWRPSSK